MLRKEPGFKYIPKQEKDRTKKPSECKYVSDLMHNVAAIWAIRMNMLNTVRYKIELIKFG